MGTDSERKDHEEEGLMGINAIHRNNSLPREAAASLFSSYFSRRFMSGWYVSLYARNGLLSGQKPVYC
jgi:hypothetical protein